MKIEIVKVPEGEYCLHPLCKKEKNFVSPKGRIRKGTVAAKIIVPFKSRVYPNRTVYYCRSCIDQILFDCRMTLDSKLWIFE